MQIQFFGAAQEVTGSCFLLTVNHQQILVDCGLIQGSYKDEARNFDPFPFDPKALDAVILTHAHLDHSGRIPLLIKRGYTGKIYTQHATVDICEVMFKDAAYINERDAEYQQKRRRKKKQHSENNTQMTPLYTTADAEAAMDTFSGVSYNDTVEVLPGVKACFRDAGHILGSAIVEVWLTDLERNDTRKIVFSGDLGHAGAPILRDPTFVEEADWVVMESTYGDRNHRDWEPTWQELGQVITDARKEKGNILIPSFALGRTQELLYTLKQHYEEWGLDQWQIFLDSPMAIRMTDIYSKHPRLFDKEATKTVETGNGDSLFDMPNLTFTQDTQDSIAINQIKSGAIIIAASGMCNGGRIKHHLKNNIHRDGCHVIFVGFQARGTKGRTLVDGAKEIRLWGETLPVKAKLHTIGGLSAHADQDRLVGWFKHFNTNPNLFLVHGEPETQETLAARIRQETPASVEIPKPGHRLL
ncbi:MAG: MBL fold metallo-hydrolase, partial [Vampirovibrio sp.]|nr:MBL fold metallo-hydrolase [Vampirovibrio sp.]